ncbi:MAG TPA: lysylphosphatidylglycerol synthase transmembrane domain-containing protein [Candidatus Bathyarchaeia archaeon]|nr:lysylphosphatidylglycerol synthase transmembrane domain-containing protein [Candidatus Bathyarchaeia archaeon]
MNWKLLAIPVSIIPFLIIAFTFNVSLANILAVGMIPFTIAAFAMACKLFTQGLKFNYLVKKLLGPVDVNWRTISVRIGSEFVTSTTPSFVGGELVRIMWLNKKGVPVGKASYVTIVEIVTEVLVSGILAISAAAFSFYYGAYAVAIAILAVSLPVTGVWSTLFFLSAKRTFQVPSLIYNIAKKIGKGRSLQYLDKTNLWMKEICDMSRETKNNKQIKKAFAVSMIISAFTWSFYGISFMVIANGAGYAIDFIHSLMATMAANAVGNLPVTIGGSGLTEFTIWAYLGHLNTLAYDAAKNSMQWNIIIAWRIATYHVGLVISWLFLMKVVYPSIKKAKTA